MKNRPEIAPGITIDRDEGFGVPVVRGTDVEVASILGELAAGTASPALEHEYGLNREGILAALAYANEIVSDLPQARSGECEEVSPGVTVDPKVRFGKAVLKGTRLDVATLLGFMAAGESIESLSSEYSVSADAIGDALRYAKSVIAREVVSAS